MFVIFYLALAAWGCHVVHKKQRGAGYYALCILWPLVGLIVAWCLDDHSVEDDDDYSAHSAQSAGTASSAQSAGSAGSAGSASSAKSASSAPTELVYDPVSGDFVEVPIGAAKPPPVPKSTPPVPPTLPDFPAIPAIPESESEPEPEPEEPASQSQFTPPSPLSTLARLRNARDRARNSRHTHDDE